MALGYLRIQHAEFSHARLDNLRAQPVALVFHVAGESQFGTRKHAHRYLGRAFEANPRVVVRGNAVVISVSPTWGGGLLQRVNYSHTWECSSVWPRPAEAQ